jgi:Universal stress protein family
MATTILIPTDFCVESLNTMRLALRSFENEKVNVILMYSEFLTDSITELLFYNPNKTIQKLKTAEFDEALSVIKNRYETSLNIVEFAVFHGTNGQAIRNFAEAKNIDLIYIPKNYRFKLLENGFNPISAIKKSKLTFHEIEWKDTSVEELQLSALFNE